MIVWAENGVYVNNWDMRISMQNDQAYSSSGPRKHQIGSTDCRTYTQNYNVVHLETTCFLRSDW